MSTKEEILQRIEAKKQILAEQKILYSQVTDELSSENQLHYRMQKALKKQNSGIKKSTQKYIDNCVQRALYEAELEYSQETLNNVTDHTEYESELEDVNEYRQKLLQYLQDYSQCRQQFYSTRKLVTNESTRMKQSCLDTSFYCQDLKTKLSHDLKKSSHSNINYESIKATKLYHKSLNESISLIADRVLDSRQELRGYFKNQIMKLQREQRIMEETEAANKLKEKKIAEENGMSTKEDIEKYLKAHKLFGADKEENTNPSSDPAAVQPTSSSRSSAAATPSTPNTKLTPKPPMAPLMPNSALSPRVGNLVSMTAASKRKIRGTQSTAMNLDEICDELLAVCQLDGKKYRLVSLKKMLQGHVMYQLCLLTLIQSDLMKINQRSQASTQPDLVPPPPPYPPSLQTDRSYQSEKEDRSAIGSDSTAPTQAHTSTNQQTGINNNIKTKKSATTRHVYLKDNLRMVDEDDGHDDTPHHDHEDGHLSRKLQYISTGLSYAQSLCLEIEALEAEVNQLTQLNETTLHSHSHQSHDKEQIQEMKKIHESLIEKLTLTSEHDEETPAEDEFNPTPPPALPPSQNNSPARVVRKTVGPNDDHKQQITKTKLKGMQSEMISQLNKQKERDRERELKYKEEKNKQRNRLFSDDVEENGITMWCREDKLKNIFVDILVSELNSSPDIPLELGFVKLSSMNLMAIDDSLNQQSESTQSQASPDRNHSHSHSNSNSRRKSSSTSAQHRVLLIEGLGTL